MSRPLVQWEHRPYTGTHTELARVRADLAHDLAGFPPDLIDTLHLCVTELFTNTVKYTHTGTEDGQVLRTLCLPDPHTLHLSISDSGGSGSTPHPHGTLHPGMGLGRRPTRAAVGGGLGHHLGPPQARPLGRPGHQRLGHLHPGPGHHPPGSGPLHLHPLNPHPRVATQGRGHPGRVHRNICSTRDGPSKSAGIASMSTSLTRCPNHMFESRRMPCFLKPAFS